MSELTDDQLDGLFRKSAEEFDSPVDSSAWPAMKVLLDDHDRTAPPPSLWKKLSRWGLPLLALLLLTGGGWYAYRNGKASTIQPTASIRPLPTGPSTKIDKETDQPAKNDPITESENKGQQTDSDNNSPVGSTPGAAADEAVSDRSVDDLSGKSVGKNTDVAKAGATTRTTKRALTTYRSTKRVTDRLRKFIAAPFSVSKNERTVRSLPTGRQRSHPASGRMSGRRQSTNSTFGLTFSKGTYATTTKPSLSSQRGAEITYLPMSTDPVQKSEQASELATFPELNLLKSRPVKLPDSLSQIQQSVEPQPVIPNQLRISAADEKGFSIRVAVSPDLSTIGLRNFSRPGTNVGLLAEYRLAKRWSLQAGIIQSMKVYRAQSGEYGYVPPPLEKYKANLAEVDGQCSMFDIPINLRYDLILKPGKSGLQPSRWFITTGVTSYFMYREYYKYTYYHEYPTNIPDWNNVNPGGYRLSNLNVSAGYERALGRRFSWQVEPFLKAPLRGIGAFKINLLSTGIFFSIRYKL